MGKYGAGTPGLLNSRFPVSCCPGSGSSSGNLAVLPASKESESLNTFILFYSVILDFSISEGKNHGILNISCTYFLLQYLQ